MKNLITIIGPTASGKTKVAAMLAYTVGGEIISGDSRQVYKGMDIGTGKDLIDYKVNEVEIPHYLIDIVPAGYKYNVYEFQRDFIQAYKTITDKGKQPILCGGSGMYIEAALHGYTLIQVPANSELRTELENKSDDELITELKKYKILHNQTDIDTRRRMIRALEIELYYANNKETTVDYPKFKPIIIGIAIDRDIRRERIDNRLKARLEEGMTDEVTGLLESGIPAETLLYYGLEYKFLTLYLTGKLSFDEMFSQLNIAIHQFAKRQMTWFRGMERRGLQIHWINGMQSIEQQVDDCLKIIHSHL